jgi:hypothetical protein
MTTERWLKAEPSAPTLRERVDVCQRVIVVGPDAFERRPLACISRFLEHMLQESTGLSCLIESSSRHLAR